MDTLHIEKDDILAPDEMIESGLYFEESKRWYNDMFLSPFVTRVAYTIFFIAYGIGFYLAIMFGMALFPLQETKKIVIKTSREPGTYIVKKHLSDFDTPAKNILGIVLKNYVLQREQYILDGQKAFDVLKQKTNFIRKYSSQDVLAQFKEEMAVSGSRADRLMSGDSETPVDILNFEFIVEEEGMLRQLAHKFLPTDPPKSAQVTFSVGGQTKMALISYIFSLPDASAKGPDAEIMLNVIEYSVIKVN